MWYKVCFRAATMGNWLAFSVVVGSTVATMSGCAPSASSASADVIEGENCVGTFRWLQKDAYRETAGRTSELWPPHTTTVLEIACPDADGALQTVDEAVQENHGTKPGAVDANGEVILVETKRDELSASRAQLKALAEAYRGCDCEGATTFLSLDSLGEQTSAELMATLQQYLATNLACPGGNDALLTALSEGRIEDALALLPACSWSNGASLAEGLDAAVTELAAATSEVLAGYHVCNNDAQLQAELWSRFATEGAILACDAESPVCQGPTWFYTP